MYYIFDYNDEYTGYEFNTLLETKEFLEHCPEGWYYTTIGSIISTVDGVKY